MPPGDVGLRCVSHIKTGNVCEIPLFKKKTLCSHKAASRMLTYTVYCRRLMLTKTSH